MLGYEKMLDEHGREMHGSWGNMIDAEDAFTRMGADVMRWQYCAQPPDRDLLFGFGPGHEIKRKLLTLWNSIGFLVQYANLTAWDPNVADLDGGPAVEHPLDRWLVARTHAFVHEATAAYEQTLTVDVIRSFEAFVDDLSNWYIRRSRPRFWRDDAAARAEEKGLTVIMNRCPKIEYGRFSGEIGWNGVNTGLLSSKKPVMSVKGFQKRSM